MDKGEDHSLLDDLFLISFHHSNSLIVDVLSQQILTVYQPFVATVGLAQHDLLVFFMTPCFSSLSNSFSTCSCSALGTLCASLNAVCISPLIIKWTSRPFIPLSEQFTILANTVESEIPVQPRILCCKQGTSLQELSSIVRLARIEWFGHWYTIHKKRKEFLSSPALLECNVRRSP